MSERAADRAAVTHLRVADFTGRRREQRDRLGEQRAVLHVVMAGEAADRDGVSCVADVGEVAQAGDVHEDRGCREAQLHQRQQ